LLDPGHLVHVTS